VESSHPTPEEIRRQMSTIRAQLGGEVDGIVSNAQELANWRHYVRAFPWGSLGVATALGYFAVPRTLQVMSPDKETLAQLAKENRLVVQHEPEVHRKPGIMATMFNLTGNMILRAGIAYLGQQAGKVFGEQAADETTQPMVKS
jgi:hypothetical protein